MKVAFYMNCVSAHQLPLAKEVAELVGPENFCYVDAEEKGQEYQSCRETTGVQVKVKGEGEQWMEESDLLLTGMRDLELFERRTKGGLRTYYTSERWFKPFGFERGVGSRCRAEFSGSLRLLVPGYRRMVMRFVKWANEDPGARVLAIGPWAKKDFLRMGVRADKIIPWGYFVSAGVGERCRCRKEGDVFEVLWCGRMLDWKRVETIIRAVKKVEKVGVGVQRKVSLTIVGDGPEKERLMRLAEGVGGRCRRTAVFTFLPSQPMEKVRELMREHDLLVLPSNGYEGWGAVVSEALEEGMRVLGTFEAGASAAILPQERLFHSGDWKTLAKLIEKEMRGELPPCSIGEWTAKAAAKRLMNV